MANTDVQSDKNLCQAGYNLLCQNGNKNAEQEEHFDIMITVVVIHSPVYGMLMQCQVLPDVQKDTGVTCFSKDKGRLSLGLQEIEHFQKCLLDEWEMNSGRW